jgi:vacuolar-type H+-ATPase subunit E/Vma4
LSSDEIGQTKLESKPDDELAFSRIKDEIEAKANTTAENVIKQAKEEAKEILKTAKDQSIKSKNDILLKSEREANNIKVQNISRKKLSLKMDFLEVREQVFDEIYIEARSKIQTYTNSDEYRTYLIELLEVSGNSIGGGKLNLQVRKEDKSVFSKDVISDITAKVANFTGQETHISLDKSDLKTLGGLMLVREDTKLFVDNTFEKRLERSNDDIRIQLSDLISE